jgi:predicted translation initiation factor SUI1
MGQSRQKTVLFLCTGNYHRSRFAEILFNSVARRMGLPWKASSRGLALERSVNIVGPMAASAIKGLEVLGIRAAEDVARRPLPATAEDLDRADRIVALKQAEHLPLLQERFPAWAEEVEYWQVDDVPEALAAIEREVMGLTARLIGGGERREVATHEAGAPEVCPRCRRLAGTCTCKAKKEIAKSAAVVRLGRETKGRRGKGVTTVSNLPLDQGGLLELAARLKQRCGTGGTVRDGRIEIQGDQRDRLAAELEGMGYRVKRTGG